MKILLAEDDNNISMIAKLTLEQIGQHQVDVVHNGADALKKALTGNYDLILLDEMMPKLNGLRVCQEYNAQTTTPQPIIFLSAKSQAEDVAEFNQHGLGHIPKPFDPTQLCQMIAQLLEKNEVA